MGEDSVRGSGRARDLFDMLHRELDQQGAVDQQIIESLSGVRDQLHANQLQIQTDMLTNISELEKKLARLEERLSHKTIEQRVIAVVLASVAAWLKFSGLK